MEHNQDVQDLALMLYRQKRERAEGEARAVHAPRSLGHELQYLPSYSDGTTTGVGGGTSTSHTDGTSHSEGTNWSHADTESEGSPSLTGRASPRASAYGESEGWSDGGSATLSLSDSRSRGRERHRRGELGRGGERVLHPLADRWAELVQSRGTSEGGSSGHADSRRGRRRPGELSKRLQKELKRYEAGEMDADEEADFRSRRVENFAMTEGESDSTGRTGARPIGLLGRQPFPRPCGHAGRSRSHGGSSAHTERLPYRRREPVAGGERVLSRGRSRSAAIQCGTNHSQSITQGTSTSDSYGGSETTGRTRPTRPARTLVVFREEPQREPVPILMPILGLELSRVTFETVEEQLFGFAQHLSGQRDRHCVVKVVGRIPCRR